MRRFFRIIRRFLIWSFVIAVVLLSAAIGLAIYFEDDVKNAIVEEINKNLVTEIQVEEINLSLLNRFPYASLTFNNVKANEVTKQKKKAKLIEAEKIYLQFNILDLLKKEYKIKRIEIKNANLFLHVFKDKSFNYDIWKPKEDSSKSDFGIELQKLVLNNVKTHFLNDAAKQDYLFDTPKSFIKGNFSNEEYNLIVNGDFNFEYLKSNNITYLQNDNVHIDVLFDVNNPKSTYKISKGKVVINKLPFLVNGMIEHSAAKKYVNLKIVGNNIPLKAFAFELPKELQKGLNAYDLDGILIFNSSVKGNIDNGKIPEVIADFSLTNGTVSRKKSNIVLKNISFSGNYSNGKMHSPLTSKVDISNFSASMKMGSFKGKFAYENFKKPNLKLNLNAKMDLSELVVFFNWDTLQNPSGTIDLNLDFNGTINNPNAFSKADFLRSKTNGKLHIEDVSFLLKGEKKEVKNLSGDFRFDRNDLIVDMLNAEYSDNKFEATGYFTNLLPFLLLKNESFWVDLTVKSENIDFDKLMTTDKTSENAELAFMLPKSWGGNLDLEIKSFQFGKFTAKNMKGNLTIKGKKFIANYFEMQSMKGKVSLNGYIDTREPGLHPIVCDALLEDVDIQDAFRDLNNFGQDKLTHEHINGKLTSKVRFESRVDKELRISIDHLFVKADIMVENGELIDYKPMQKLAKFIKVDDLSRIKFSTLKNKIEIKNKTIYIPEMRINSSALDLDVSGTHKFTNEIDYKLKLELANVLWNKARNARRENSEFGIIEDDGIHTSLFVKVTGTVDEPEFKYDRKSVAKKISNDIKQEKENLKKIFKEEFHWFVRDSVKKAIREEQKKEQKIEKNEFEIIWDEDTL